MSPSDSADEKEDELMSKITWNRRQIEKREQYRKIMLAHPAVDQVIAALLVEKFGCMRALFDAWDEQRTAAERELMLFHLEHNSWQMCRTQGYYVGPAENWILSELDRLNSRPITKETSIALYRTMYL